MTSEAKSKILSRMMILAFVGVAFAFGATMLLTSHDGLLFADMAANAR